jgi:hypothetical protein
VKSLGTKPVFFFVAKPLEEPEMKTTQQLPKKEKKILKQKSFIRQ